jgi:hypothetical protein
MKETKFVTCPECGCVTDLSDFPDYEEGEMNHWKECNQLRPEDETPEE